VVLVHGYGSSKSSMLDHATFIHDRYNLVLFDLRNGQQSTGDITTQGIREQRDLEAILDWLERTKAPERIAVLGESMGGHTAVNVAARDARVDALILASTHDTLKRAMVARVDNAGHPGELVWPAIWMGSWLRTGENVLGQDPIAVVDDIRVPLLLMHGGADRDAPPASAEELRRAAVAAGVDVTVHICADADHGKIDEVCAADYGTWLNEFLDRALP
jgi:pimeloyl-ACP methyl ester carboxylesterase